MSRNVAVAARVRQIEKQIRLDAAAPVIILIVESTHRPKPVDHAVQHMDAKIHERPAARLGTVKIEARHAVPIERSAISVIVVLNGTEQTRFDNQLQQGMASGKAPV